MRKNSRVTRKEFMLPQKICWECIWVLGSLREFKWILEIWMLEFRIGEP